MKKIFFLLPLILMGCTISQKITYQTDDLSVPTSVKPIPIMVEVRILVDNRLQVQDNKVLFSDPRNTNINGKASCINSEKHYKKDTVAREITKLIAEHFNKLRVFSLTYYNQNSYCGYYLTGTLNSFYGEQAFSRGAMVGAQFGLIGALATAGIKTHGKIVIEIADIKLYKKDGTLLKDFGNFYKEYNDDMSADAYCWCIYRNINEKLKDFNSHFAEKIRTDLAEIKFE